MRRAAGRRQRSALLVLVRPLPALLLVLFSELLLLRLELAALTVVMVLMVAVAVWVTPVRLTLEGKSEQLAYWPGVTGVQLSTTVPLNPFRGVRVRL
jgi:hypothetical protein